MRILIAAILTVLVSSMPAHADLISGIATVITSIASSAGIGKIILGIVLNVACSPGIRIARKADVTHDGD